MARAEREPASTGNIPLVTTDTADGLGAEGPVGVHWHDPRGTGTVRHWHDPRSAWQLGSDLRAEPWSAEPPLPARVRADYARGLVDDDEDEALGAPASPPPMGHYEGGDLDALPRPQVSNKTTALPCPACCLAEQRCCTDGDERASACPAVRAGSAASHPRARARARGRTTVACR